MSFFTRGLRRVLPLLAAALTACRDGAAPEPPTPAGDRTPPTFDITGPTQGSLHSAQLRLFGNAFDSTGVARVTYQLDGAAEVELGLQFHSPTAGDRRRAFFDAPVTVGAGPHRVVLHAYDAAGNRGSSPAIDVGVDATAPRIQLAAPGPLTVHADTVRVRATVTDDVGLRFVEVTVGSERALMFLAPDTGRLAQYALDTLVTLAVGVNEINLSSQDRVANQTRARVLVTRTAAPAPARFDAIAAAAHFGCGLRSSAAYCWGSGQLGQLGNGRAISRDTPVPVSGGLAFSSLGTAWAWSCGVTTAAALYCWGADFYAALGRGATTGGLYSTPQRVASNVQFATVSVGTTGGYTSCALATSGEAYCWGLNSGGQAGVPRSTATCELAGVRFPCVPVPARVQGGLRFSSISVGSDAACGVATDGRGYCWGAHAVGGNGERTGSSDTPVPVSGGLVFASISVGDFHACGITTAGEAYCWGSNRGGALGDGTTVDRVVPARVSSTVRFRSVGVLPSAGNTAGGACARAEDGTVHCWGGGRAAPARLDGGLTFTSVSPSHRCGIAPDRTAYCWTLTSGPVPVPGDYPPSS
jgi:alpha-tubulin suppressor-like RCC1 family protein